MAITATTISAAVKVGDLVIPVTSATGFATSATAPQYVKIDNEYMVIAPSYVSGTNIPVYRRGDQGSAQVAHNALAICTTGLFSDLPALAPMQDAAASGFMPFPSGFSTVQYYSVSGAITVPTANTMVVLNKAGVAAMTLAAPIAGTDGVLLYVTSATAQAHTVAATSLIGDGTSGSPHTTATFTTGYIGQGMLLVVANGIYNVISAPHVAFT